MLERAMKKRWKYACIGTLLSFIGPLGEWLVVEFALQEGDSFLFITLIYIEVFCLLLFTSFGYILGRQTEKIEKMAFHDQLTGLYNRHYVIDKLNELVELSHRYRKGFSLMMLDLDHFKRVNDKHGHLAGDRTLVAVA